MSMRSSLSILLFIYYTFLLIFCQLYKLLREILQYFSIIVKLSFLPPFEQVIFFLFILCLVNFHCMIVILNSTLLLPAYLCISTDCLELYSEAQLSHLFLRFYRTVAVLISGITMSLCGINTLLNALPSVLWVLRFFTLVDGTGTSLAHVSTGHCSPTLMGGSFLVLVIFLDLQVDQYRAKYLRRPSVYFWAVAIIEFTSLVFCLPRITVLCHLTYRVSPKP